MPKKKFKPNKKLRITQLQIDSINSKGTIYGMVVTEQYPYFSNTFIRYGGGGLAYDNPHKLTKKQKQYLTKLFNKYKKPIMIQ